MKRTFLAVRARAFALGFRSDRFWSESEIHILRKYYPTEGKNVANRLPGRSEAQCMDYAATTLKLKTIHNLGKEVICIETGKIYNSYRDTAADGFNIKAIWAGLKRKTGTVAGYHWAYTCDKDLVESLTDTYANKTPLTFRWTADELQILAKYYPTEGSDVYTRLPGRSAQNCVQAAHKHGIKLTTKKVMCVETNEIFDTITQARKAYPDCDIGAVVRGVQKSSRKLHWKYVEEEK